MCSLSGRFRSKLARQGCTDDGLTAVSRLQKPKQRVQDMVFLSPLDYNSVASELQQRGRAEQDPLADMSLDSMPQMPQ
jgi:hypothetical protein